MGIVARTAYWVEWWRRFCPASGNEPKLTDPVGLYVITTFVKGTNTGPYEAAWHIPGVSGHELSYTGLPRRLDRPNMPCCRCTRRNLTRPTDGPGSVAAGLVLVQLRRVRVAQRAQGAGFSGLPPWPPRAGACRRLPCRAVRRARCRRDGGPPASSRRPGPAHRRRCGPAIGGPSTLWAGACGEGVDRDGCRGVPTCRAGCRQSIRRSPGASWLPTARRTRSTRTRGAGHAGSARITRIRHRQSLQQARDFLGSARSARALMRDDETEALRVVEPLHRASSHVPSKKRQWAAAAGWPNSCAR